MRRCVSKPTLRQRDFAKVRFADCTVLLRAIRCPEVPRYYFHIRRGRATVLDHNGIDLADDQEAAREAARRGREIAKSDTLNGNPPTSVAIVVANEWSTVVEVPVV